VQCHVQKQYAIKTQKLRMSDMHATEVSRKLYDCFVQAEL